MPRRASIAEARDNLPRIVHEVEGGDAVEITRRGESVAILVDIQTWRRLQSRRPSVMEGLEAYWATLGPEAEDFDPSQVFGDVRDRSPGKDVVIE